MLPQVAAALAPYAGQAQVVGLTGSPGVGKSTTTNELVRALRARGHRVGVLAVDPSSPFTGGAILGDRVRMQDHATDPGVYIRSMSSRGHLGGLSAATPQAVRVLEGAGCDVVLVETVGVGQAEVEVASLADTTLVLLAPGMGDAIQAVKAGILEIADVFVVNKADRDGADATVRDIQGMIALGERGPGEWRPQVVRAVAVAGRGHRRHRRRDRQAPGLAGRARRAAPPPGDAGRRRDRGDRAGRAARPDRLPARRYGAAGARREGGRRAPSTRTRRPTNCSPRSAPDPSTTEHHRLVRSHRATDPWGGATALPGATMDHEATQELSVTPDAVAGGTTQVSDEVVEKIAVAAAKSVPGVAELGGDVARFFNAVLDKVGLDQVGDARRGCSAHVTNGAAVVNLVLVIAAGHAVPQVTEAVRAAVTAAVEAYGLRADEINITGDDRRWRHGAGPTARVGGPSA